MKTLFTTIALILFATTATMAQPLKIGIRGGINTSSHNFTRFNIDATTIAPAKASIGYQIAIVARLSIPKFIQIQPELVYSTRNYSYQLNSSELSQRTKISTKRMELPVLLGFNIAALRLFAGPVFTLSSSESSNNKDSQLKVKYNHTDVAMQLGAGLDIKKFFMDVRYTSALKSTYHTFTLADQSHKSKIKTDELWSFSMGFFF